MGTVVLIIIGAIVVLALVGWAAEAAKDRKALAELPDGERQRALAIREKSKAILKAEAAHDRRERDAEAVLERAAKGEKLASYTSRHVGGVRDAFAGDRKFVLWDSKIETPRGTHDLNEHVSATVDTAGGIAGKSRSTLTRMGGGALIAGPVGLLAGAAAQKGRIVDARELYLLVEGDTWADSTTCDPGKDGAKVREFAAQVNAAARRSTGVAAARATRVAELTAAVDVARTDRSEIERLEAERDALGPDPTGMTDRIERVRAELTPGD